MHEGAGIEVAKEIEKMGNRVPKLRPREAEELAQATHCECVL